MDLKAAYKAQAEACGINAGDKVKIVRTFDGTLHDKVTRSAFGSGTTDWVGEIGLVEGVTDMGNFKVLTPESSFARNVPWYCLELISKGEKPITIGEHTVKFIAGGIKVGCQEISKDTVGKIYRRLNDDK